MKEKHITSLISQLFGKFASKEYPKWFQNIINKSYVSLMGLDMHKFYAPTHYKSLNALFTRKLKIPRVYSLDGSDFISPCDALITEVGAIKNDYALQIKGMRYKASELLSEHISNESKALLEGGDFCNLYLSPKDYHRYHIPINLKVLKVVHIPGKFYPVNIPSLKKRLNLFVENERVVLECEALQNKKRFFIVLVSALNVGVMRLSFLPELQTNSNTLEPKVYEFDELYLNKGDDFGCFEMGSTIVLLSQKGMLNYLVTQGQKVSFGDVIAKLV